MVHGLVVEELGVDDGAHDLLHEGLLEVRGRDRVGVLGRDDDRVDAERADSAVRGLLVLDRDLGLRVRAQPAELSRATEVCHLLVERVRERERERHQFGCLVRGVSEPVFFFSTGQLRRTQ